MATRKASMGMVDIRILGNIQVPKTSESDQFVVFGGRLVGAWIAVGFEGRS
jgi:hypothetical protein